MTDISKCVEIERARKELTQILKDPYGTTAYMRIAFRTCLTILDEYEKVKGELFNWQISYDKLQSECEELKKEVQAWKNENQSNLNAARLLNNGLEDVKESKDKEIAELKEEIKNDNTALGLISYDFEIMKQDRDRLQSIVRDLPTKEDIEKVIRDNGQYRESFACGLSNKLIVYPSHIAGLIYVRIRKE